MAALTTDVMTVQNEIDADGIHRLHLMSSMPIENHPWVAWFGSKAERKVYQDELKIWHVDMAWPAREPIMGFRRKNGKLIEHRCVLWSVLPGDLISEQIKNAAQGHFNHSHLWPDYAWLHALPKNVENGDVINMEFCEIIILQADWVPARCIAVGCAPWRYR